MSCLSLTVDEKRCLRDDYMYPLTSRLMHGTTTALSLDPVGCNLLMEARAQKSEHVYLSIGDLATSYQYNTTRVAYQW